jgi:hypothetical protein
LQRTYEGYAGEVRKDLLFLNIEKKKKKKNDW